MAIFNKDDYFHTTDDYYYEAIRKELHNEVVEENIEWDRLDISLDHIVHCVYDIEEIIIGKIVIDIVCESSLNLKTAVSIIKTRDDIKIEDLAPSKLTSQYYWIKTKSMKYYREEEVSNEF